jgi:hypothetical protein
MIVLAVIISFNVTKQYSYRGCNIILSFANSIHGYKCQRYKIAENVSQLPMEKVGISKLISYKIKTQSNTIESLISKGPIQS